jgi:4-hydroxy-tetrahydrodipicolinate reductase
MVNGIPGNMAVNVARHIFADERFALVPFSLTGPEIQASEHTLESIAIRLLQPKIGPGEIEAIIQAQGPFISVDYTHPSAVNDNAAFYCQHQLPFVMGTTGGDRERLEKTVQSSAIAAVIAPNMAKQIVGFQAMMAYAAQNFPDLFDGYSLEIKESHQKGKADTSGTAKAMATYFDALGTPCSGEDIIMERDPDAQKSVWGVPEEHLEGHGYHTYTLVSDDGTVRFQFTHNVNGREIYGKGTLDAILYLNEKLKEGATGTVFSMIDVLKGGS